MSQGSKLPRGLTGSRGGPPVPLKPRTRAVIPSSPTQRIKELLSRNDAAHLVRTAPVQDLFLLVKQVGLSDALEVLELASPEQLQRMIDLDAWVGDELKLDTYGEWLTNLVEAKGAEKARALFEGLDPEPLILYLQEHIKAHLIEEDMPEDQRLELEAKSGFQTPDRRYFVELGLDDEQGDFCRRLIELAYVTDLKLAYWLMESSRWELASTLEEQAYRLRTGRLEELGLFDSTEALIIYSPLRDHRPTPREPLPQPAAGPFREIPLALEHIRPSDGSFLSQALERLREVAPDDDLSRELLRLANKVVAADRLDLGELETLTTALRQVRAYVGLGLELESDGDLEHAVELLQDIHVEWLFRRGFTRAIELQRQARRLEQHVRPTFRRLAGPHADSPYREMLEGLLQQRPLYYTGLEGDRNERFVPFQSRAQVDRTVSALARLEAIYRFVFEFLAPGPVELSVLRSSFEQQGLELTPGGVFLTSIAQRLLGEAFAPEPLTQAQLRAFLTRALEPGAPAGVLRPLAADFVAQVKASVDAFAASAGELGEHLRAAVTPFVDDALATLREAYGALDLRSPLELELVGGPLYLRSER